MRRLLTALLICLFLPAAAAERPRAGLMWNRSGLPATFPLQVRTPAGRDYVVFLIAPDSGRAVMAGYIRGGNFFRLLVPPGTYLLRFAHGLGWQGETQLFGPDTEWVEAEEPVDFRIIGTGRRSGYLVTLVQRDGTVKLVDTRSQHWCQIASWRISPRDWPDTDDLLALPDPTKPREPRDPDWQLRLRSRLCA